MDKRKSKSVKILLIQIANRNLGDTAIADATRFLISQCMKGKNYQIFDYSITSGDMIPLAYVDVIVFSGGGLIKYRQEQYDLHVSQILVEAERLHIPVFFNAVGVEGYDHENERCQQLKHAINLPCVKGISVRDDYNTLKDYYISNPEIAVTSVFDPATWSNRIYRRISFPSNRLIGLGITREGLFSDYGNPQINREFQLEFWKKITEELEKKGFSWTIFTNGAGGDEEFAETVLAHIGHGSRIPRPAEPRQLINSLCSFTGIIACRMHTHILAHTFGIPSVGVVWNKKIDFWAKKIGHTDRFLQPSEMNATHIVNKVIQAISEGCNILSEDQLMLAANALYSFLNRWATVRSQGYRHDHYRKMIVADACGGKYLKYKNLNTANELVNSIKHGCRWVEVDVRLSSDNKLVCVNGWNKDTYARLGLNPINCKQSISAKEYARLYHLGTYPTTSFEDMVKLLAYRWRSRYIRVILDVGRPSQKDLTQMMIELQKIQNKYWLRSNRFVIRLQRICDVELFRKLKMPWEITYYLPSDTEKVGDGPRSIEEIASLCKDRGISYVTMPLSRFDTKVSSVLHRNSIGCCVLKVGHTGDVLNALDNGADLVCSIYMQADTLRQLTM